MFPSTATSAGASTAPITGLPAGLPSAFITAGPPLPPLPKLSLRRDTTNGTGATSSWFRPDASTSPAVGPAQSSQSARSATENVVNNMLSVVKASFRPSGATTAQPADKVLQANIHIEKNNTNNGVQQRSCSASRGRGLKKLA